MKPWKDPIVEEVHHVRARMLKECGGSLDRLMDRIAARQGVYGGRLVTREALLGRKRRAKPAPAIRRPARRKRAS